jgi:hypothetical protein
MTQRTNEMHCTPSSSLRRHCAPKRSAFSFSPRMTWRVVSLARPSGARIARCSLAAALRLGHCVVRCRCKLHAAPPRDTRSALALRLLRTRADAAARSRLPRNLPDRRIAPWKTQIRRLLRLPRPTLILPRTLS